MAWSLRRARPDRVLRRARPDRVLRRARPDRVPDDARSAIDTGPGERLLSWGHDEGSGATVVASNHRLYAVSPAGEVVLARPWHLVDSGTWSHDAYLLTVTWVDRHRPAQWVFREPTLLPETLRERVQASVVLAQKVDLGERRSARVVIRQELATGALLEQVVPGRGVRVEDPEVERLTRAALADLKEQVGLA